MASSEKACERCHQKKIRCSVARDHNACWPCRSLNQPCVPHNRKRKKYPQPEQAGLEEPASKRPTTASAPSPSSPAPPMATSTCIGVPPSDSQSYTSHNIPSQGAPDVGNTPASYLGRAEYVSGTIPIDEEDARQYPPEQQNVLSLHEMNYLRAIQAFDPPTRSLRDGLIAQFMERCHPWMPIIGASELQAQEPSRFPQSLLLLNSVLVAGSRVSMASQGQASGNGLYRSAKALFHLGHEMNGMAAVRAAIILQWWNPSGPEHISMDASSFWLHMAVGLAHQLGLHREPTARQEDARLRRRVWWTLFTRDCMICMSHGRPRVINWKDCDVRPLTLADFPEPSLDAHLFLAYIEIASILGDLTEAAVRGNLVRAKSVSLQSRTLAWIRGIPQELRISRPNDAQRSSYNLKARQLHTLYLTALMLLFRPSTGGSGLFGAAVLAASFSAGIFADMLARGEIQFLASTHIFHLMAAAYAHLACCRYPLLWTRAEADMEIIDLCLVEMAKRFPTATGAQRVVNAVSRAVKSMEKHEEPPLLVFGAEHQKFYELLDPELCSQWDTVHQHSTPRDHLYKRPSKPANDENGSIHISSKNNTPPLVGAAERVPPNVGQQRSRPLELPPSSQNIIEDDFASFQDVGFWFGHNMTNMPLDSPGQWILGDWP